MRTDVATATKGGKVEEIFCFFGQNLPIAKRHALQNWATENYGVALEIFDGTAIAELLADRDVFWIAQEFLHIPAEILPALADEDGWYGTLLRRWISRTPPPLSAADFSEIKFGLRRATFHEEARPNLLLWIGLMERFLEPPAPRHLQRSAIYEIAVAHLRGKGEMTSQADKLRNYFTDLGDWLAVADLKDAAVLQTYAFGGSLLRHLDMESAELFAWRTNLLSLLDREIATAPGPGRRSGLLDIRGYLKLLPDGPGVEPSVDQTFDDWERMLEEAEETPLFPIADFASHLSKMTGALGHHPRFEKFAERVDELLAKRQGPVLAAESTFERALAFYEADDLLHAVRDLHRIQIRWYTGDSMVRFQQASFMLATSYLELGAAYAAKYVALAAAYLARSSDDIEVASTAPKLLFCAADAEDGAGNSVSYLHLLLFAMLAHFEQDPDPLEQEKHSDIEKQLGQAAALRGFAARSGPSQLVAIDRALSIWPAPFRESVVRASLDPEGFWTKGTSDEVWSTMEQSFLDRPFGDLGASRTISWCALGIRWTAGFINDIETIAVAEEFVASLQIALVSLVRLSHLPESVCRV